MNLRNRSILVLALTFLVFFLIIAAVSVSVTLQGLDRIEYRDMSESITQAQAGLDAEASALLITVHDWAWWDDTVYFTVNNNTSYLDDNANPSAMATLNIHLFGILDRDGNLLYGRVLSPDFETDAAIPDDFLALIRDNPQLTFQSENYPGASGLLLSSEGPMVFASSPILHSDQSGPASGTVFMGRYVDHGPLQRINDMTGYHLALYAQSKGPDDSTPPGMRELQSGQQTMVILPDNETATSGYSLVRDLAGKDLVLKVTLQRELYQIGRSNLYTLLMLLAIWAVITCVIVVVVMDRTVLNRLSMLTNHVRLHPDSRNGIPPAVLSGNDELTELEKTITESRRDLLVREQQLRAFVNAMPGPVALFSCSDGKILLVNPSFAESLNRRPEEITGSDIRSVTAQGDLERYNRYLQDVIRTKEPVHFEEEKDGRTLLMSYYPVIDSHNNVIQVGILALDISDRKRLENALQKVTKKIALLNTVIFQDIQNKVFVQMGYLELARQLATDTRVRDYMEKEEVIVGEIQSSLQFAKQYNDMGVSPPRWQNVLDVMLFAVSHIELGSITRDFQIEGLEIFADSLLERVFVTLIENTVMYAEEASFIRARFTIIGDEAVIIVEDDGPGIPEDKKEEIFKKGMGAGGSTSLFLSREILSITGITIRENGVAGQGARFEIRVPKGSYRFTR